MEKLITTYRNWKLSYHHWDDDMQPKVRLHDPNDDFIGDYDTVKKAKQAVDRRLKAKGAFKPFNAIYKDYTSVHEARVNSIAKDGARFNLTYQDRNKKTQKSRIYINNAQRTLYPHTPANNDIMAELNKIKEKRSELYKQEQELRAGLEPFTDEAVEKWMKLRDDG